MVVLASWQAWEAEKLLSALDQLNADQGARFTGRVKLYEDGHRYKIIFDEEENAHKVVV